MVEHVNVDNGVMLSGGCEGTSRPSAPVMLTDWTVAMLLVVVLDHSESSVRLKGALLRGTFELALVMRLIHVKLCADVIG